MRVHDHGLNVNCAAVVAVEQLVDNVFEATMYSKCATSPIFHSKSYPCQLLPLTSTKGPLPSLFGLNQTTLFNDHHHTLNRSRLFL